MWLIFGLLAGIIFGIGDIVTKSSLRSSSLISVLLLTFAGSMLLWPVLIAIQQSDGLWAASEMYAVAPFSAIKSLVVVISSLLCFAAIKALPMTASAVIRVSGMIWPTLGAFLFLGEILSISQCAAVLFVLAGGLWLVVISRTDKGDVKLSLFWFLSMITGVFLSSSLGIIDRYVLRFGFSATIYQMMTDISCLIFVGAIFILMSLKGTLRMKDIKAATPALFIGATFTMAELTYLHALAQPGSVVGIASLLRRTSLITSLIGSIFFFNDFRAKRDLPAAFSVGAAVIVLGVGLYYEF